MKTWNDYESAAKQGPMQIFWRAIGPLVVIVVVLALIGHVLGWFGGAANVAQRELGAQALLDKYTWFKEASAQLDKKQADIKVYDARIKSLDDQYKDVPRAKWPREDREQRNVWASELAGVKAGYNLLAADYNAKMAEVHWRFTNAGELPQGASTPLPREYKPYVEE